MFSTFKAAWPTALAIASLQLTAWPAQAQPAAPAPTQALLLRADPADPKAPVPAALYASPLRTYQRFAEPPVAPWRDTNEVVRQREGAPPAPGAAPAASHPAGASQPAASGHSGHRMK
jgi:hypothetical protein